MKWLFIVPLLLGVAFVTRQDDEEKAERAARGQRALSENCLMCHSEELIVHQRLTPSQWKTEVTKMIGWGAPLPPGEVEELVAYLAATYPVSRGTMRPDRIAPAAIAEEFRQEAPRVVAASVLSEGERLYVQHCLVCHGKEARGGDLGQNLVGHPNLLNLADSVEVVRVGRRRMPGFAAVLNDDQARSIVAWLVSRPFD